MLMMIFNAPVDKLHDKKMISFYLTIFIYFVFIWWRDGWMVVDIYHLKFSGEWEYQYAVFKQHCTVRKAELKHLDKILQ